jgi:hypothetical protein
MIFFGVLPLIIIGLAPILLIKWGWELSTSKDISLAKLIREKFIYRIGIVRNCWYWSLIEQVRNYIIIIVGVFGERTSILNS